MTDTVIKGSGNSRSIKTVPNIKSMVSNLDDLLDLFIAGFPCDFGPLNDAGVQTRGMDLTKANLLSDATAALYGKGDNASPDEILAEIRSLITAVENTANGKAKIQYGSYAGNGSKSKTIAFSFSPSIVLLQENYGDFTVFVRPTIAANAVSGSNSYNLSVAWGTNSVTYSHGQYPILNNSGRTECYVGIG